MAEPTEPVQPQEVAPSRPEIMDKRWAQAGQDLRLNQVKDLRSAAEQWRNGLAGFTALVALAAVVKGPDTVQELTSTGRVSTAVAAGLALACLLFGSWCAMRAAFGVPGEKVLLSGAELKRWSDRQVDAGVADLSRARRSFLAGVVLLALATGITWFNAPTAKTPSAIKVTVAGKPHCGKVIESSGGQLVLDEGSPGGEETVVRLRDVDSLALVSSCD